MKALLIGDTGGIGTAIAETLRAEGADVTGLSRRDGLELTDQDSVARAAEKLGDSRFDLIFNATGALVIDGHQPEKTIRAIDAEAMAAQFRLNAIGVALLLRYFSPLLAEEGRAVFASLSARVGSIGDNGFGGWISYRAAKAAQNQIIRTAAIEIARKNKQRIVVALHPGTVETPLTRDYADRHPTITPARSAEALLGVIAGLTHKDNGTFWDWKGQPVEW
ncbi:SDR family NAD(P)-dependent oxidoreductase [Paracoccus sediminicola]|uniref:SDR family NAD(P)-dependent oxidoreductase n=1 Tax=Paracoccus sediminicola TaxID=3017783 RepID=UPI0022F084ED|nr:SDR family NAD(P)-dependent oxidoreductase [Paracoccus sediminicola]WBU57525.1 SDR family NAD(P)-dependent oxidoreductase [Paracoccus sediminicola]